MNIGRPEKVDGSRDQNQTIWFFKNRILEYFGEDCDTDKINYPLMETFQK